MKKIALVVLTVAFCSSISLAQVDKSFYKKPYESRNNGTFDQSTMIVSFGLGFPNTAVGNYGFGYAGNHSSSPAMYIKFEHGIIRDEVGLGGFFSTGWGNYKNGNDKDKLSAVSFGVLGYYHFNKLIPIEKMDVYAGAGLGVRSIKYNDDDDTFDNTDTDVILIVKVGIRYYVVKNFAVYAESGYDGMSAVNLGGSFRF